MFSIFTRLISGTALFLVLASGALHASINPKKVVVLANANSADSMEVARYYMNKRSIPEGNLVLLPMTLEEQIDWPTFVREIYNPLLDHLVQKNWISALTGSVIWGEMYPNGYPIGTAATITTIRPRITQQVQMKVGLV